MADDPRPPHGSGPFGVAQTQAHHAAGPTWLESERFVPRRFVRPVQVFLRTEASGGILMLVAAVVALVWANSPFGDSYRELWHTHLDVHLGDLLHFDLTLEEWVNDALMVIFFFVVGLEIKRELVVGELRDPKAAALPAIAALGGMVVPALVFLAFNAGEPTSKGWGIPMATDIAFAVGVVSLLSDRVPVGAKLFLLALAIVDDLGAIAVIAIFYTSDLSLGWLAAAIAVIVVTYVVREAKVRSVVPFIVLGVCCWVALHESGVHATITGVVFGFLTPVNPFYKRDHFRDDAVVLVESIDRSFDAGPSGHERGEAGIQDLVRLATETESPLDRIEHKLLPWSSYVIIPLFALANAGVELTGDTISGAAGEPVVLGIALGLVVGKTIGIFGATWLAVKTGLGRLPDHTIWRDILGLGALGGIGFTVALFVANLSFTDPEVTDLAKVGILSGSLLAGIIGYTFLRLSPLNPAAAAEAAEAARAHDEAGQLPIAPADSPSHPDDG